MSPLLKQICLVTIGISSFTNLSAQTSEIAKSNSEKKDQAIGTEKSPGLVVNSKALSHFKGQYPEAVNETWSLNEDCYRAKFTKDAIQYLVDYTISGQWRSTCRLFDESEMPEKVRRMVKFGFPNYTIVTVTELIYRNNTSHFVKIEDAHNLKTVRVMDGEMEVVEAYKKR